MSLISFNQYHCIGIYETKRTLNERVEQFNAIYKIVNTSCNDTGDSIIIPFLVSPSACNLYVTFKLDKLDEFTAEKHFRQCVIIIPCIQRESGVDHTAGTRANHEMSPPPVD